MRIQTVSLVLLLCALALFPTPARADGIIIPEPPICEPGPCPMPPLPMEQLVIRYHHVTVAIQDQVTVTRVDQVFYNPNDWEVEGTYVFPLPEGAVVNEFTLWVDERPVEGEILDAEQARQIYEETVRSLRDPALLEYADRGAVKASIYPIPPGGERRIELEYTQALTAENGLVRYVYPLNTEKFSAWPLESVSVGVDIRSTGAPIRAVYSPSHEVSINRAGEGHVTVGYEENNVTPETDFVLYYSLGEQEAFHLLTYRDPADPTDPDGFFLLLLAPRPEAESQSVAKDVLLVLDRSGSMEGEKFQQAQEALRYILRHLNPEDRFNIITFSTDLQTYAGRLRPASEAEEAIAWVDRQSAAGSTDINRALLEAAAIAEGERPTYLIFLTDGLPTTGETDSERILANFAASAPADLRLFAFGVGYDVDTFLLDSLAEEHHGSSAYVLPDERLDETLSAFYAKISTPVLTDLELDFGNLPVYDLYPSPLPDLFAGSQIIVVGRYRKGGTTDVLLSGEVNGRRQTFRFEEQVFPAETPTDGTRSAIPRLWATRKIGYLLKQVRLYGPNEEIVDQIVKLSIRYGVVTPYTSYLVTEEMPLGQAQQERIAEQEFAQMEAAPAAPFSGPEAVQKAADEGQMSAAESVAAPPAEAADVVKIVGARTFVLRDGVWVDTAFDPDTMQTVKVPFLSEDYFALAEARPELGEAFALGPRVIVLSEGVAYEVVDSEVAAPPVGIPPTRAPTEAPSSRPTSAPSPSSPTSPPAFPCLGGMLPLALAALGVLFRRR